MRDVARVLIAVIGATGAYPAAKDLAQRWTAVSRTAIAITGDLALAPQKITIERKDFPLTLVREIDSAHLEDAGKVADFPQPPSSARLYKTVISRRSVLAGGNAICGADKDARWMLAVYGKNQLSLAFFSSSAEPSLDPKVTAVSHELCGTYAYVSQSAEK